MKPDFNLIEKELNILIPSFYKEAISNYLSQAKDFADLMEYDLVTNTKWLVDENKELRKNGFLDQKWPEHFFAIGYDGCGDYYFLNLNDNDTRVFYADHEIDFDYNNLDDLVLNSSIEEFVEVYLEQQYNELMDDDQS